MASFPTTAITYASRSNGQTIDASHVNSLQDEIAAIEAGYLDASARLNSSNSTVANLSVAGGSTFTGSVTFSSVATFSTKVAPASTAVMLGDSTTGFKELHCSSAYVGGVSITALSAPVSVKVTHSADVEFTAGDGAFAGLNWDTEEYDSTAMHSTAANSSRLTFAGSTGIYHVGAALASSWAGASTASFEARIVLNDSTTMIAAQAIPCGQRGRQMVNLGGDLRVAATTDFVTVQYRAVGTSTGRIHANSTMGPTAFWSHRIST